MNQNILAFIVRLGKKFPSPTKETMTNQRQTVQPEEDGNASTLQQIFNIIRDFQRDNAKVKRRVDEAQEEQERL